MKNIVYFLATLLALYYSSISTVNGAMRDHGGGMMQDSVSVPEPGTTALLGIGLLALFIVSKFKK